MIVLCALALGGCGSPRTTVVENASLEKAIAFYIDGDLQRSEALFNAIIKHGRADDDYRTACLYLGRIYLAQHDYERAADALWRGKALGGDVRFDEYLEIAQRHLSVSPKRILQLETVTREQLAGLIDQMFGSVLVDSGGTTGAVMASAPGAHREADAEREADRDPIGVVTRTGVMTRFADGEFHPDEKVTRPAFCAVVARLAGAIDAPPGVMNEMFPGGYRESLSPQSVAAGDRGGIRFLSGREAVEVLQALARRVGS